MDINQLKVGKVYRAYCAQCSNPVLSLKILSVCNSDKYVHVVCKHPIPECWRYSSQRVQDGVLCGVLRSRFIEEIIEVNTLGNFPKKSKEEV